MGMNLGSGPSYEDETIVDINTTPLIDVMLVLLIMLIITIPLQTHSVSLELPQGNPPTNAAEPNVVTVGIDFDDALSWNGAPLSSQKELDDRLRALATMADQPELHVHPDKLARYDTVAHVLADAQRLGITKLGIVGHDQFMNGN